MNQQTITKLHELSGTLQACSMVAGTDADRAKATQPEMCSPYYKGYYQAEENTHRQYARKFERLLTQVLDIIKEAENA